MFLHLSDAKVKGAIFTGPHIHMILSFQELEQKMTGIEKNAWKAFRTEMIHFLGNNKEIVATLIKHHQVLGCRISIKLYYWYLHSHLDIFQSNLGDVSEEHGECFHQVILTMQKRYLDRCDAALMRDYIWSLVRADSSSFHKRKCIFFFSLFKVW